MERPVPVHHLVEKRDKRIEELEYLVGPTKSYRTCDDRNVASIQVSHYQKKEENRDRQIQELEDHVGT